MAHEVLHIRVSGDSAALRKLKDDLVQVVADEIEDQRVALAAYEEFVVETEWTDA